MTTIDHPRHLYPVVSEAWSGPAPDRVGSTNPDPITTRWEWDTDLTAEQVQAFDDVVQAAAAGMVSTDWSAIKAEVARIKAFYQNPSPTQAEAVGALKDVIRVLYKVLRQEG